MNINYTFLNRLFILVLIMTQYSCQKDKLEGEIIVDPEFIENLYNNSSDSIRIDNQNLILEANIFRNLSPGGPINDKDRRLLAFIYIVNTDSILITENLNLIKLYLINQDQVWISELQTRPDIYVPEYKTARVSERGPEWETGIYVDAILSITDLTNNEEKYLIARNQIIVKVE